MRLSQLSLTDFRSYPSVELDLGPGASVFVGPNGHGKTNLLEAVCYLATLGSHRVASDRPLVRLGAERAILRATALREERSATVELEITPGQANRARLNRAPVSRTRDVLGVVRAVWFAPQDLALVTGDPQVRRRFLDELLVLRTPRFAGVRQDYERILRQRNALLKSAGHAVRAGAGALRTLDVWDSQLARAGAELVTARLRLVDLLRPHAVAAYAGLSCRGGPAQLGYQCSFAADEPPAPDDVDGWAALLLGELARRRREELDRRLSLVGPHRDELALSLGPLPVKGYASHGESWSFAVALRVASYRLLCEEGPEPILLLDDVFAELDGDRRDRLAEIAAGAEQTLVTAAVAADVPAGLAGTRFAVREGTVRR